MAEVQVNIPEPQPESVTVTFTPDEFCALAQLLMCVGGDVLSPSVKLLRGQLSHRVFRAWRDAFNERKVVRITGSVFVHRLNDVDQRHT